MMLKPSVAAAASTLFSSMAYRRVLGLGVVAVVLAGCSAAGKAPHKSGTEGLTRDEQQMVEAPQHQSASTPAPVAVSDVGVSLSDLPPAWLPSQNSAACLADIESMAERYSGRRVMLGEAAFVGKSELVLDQPLGRGRSGKVADGKRLGLPEPFVMQLRFGPRGCMVVVPAQASAIRPVPASTLLPNCRCQYPQGK